jgi:hypothetical protein
LEDSTSRLSHLERVAGEGVFLDDQQGQPARTGAGIGVGTRQESNNVRSPGECTPRFRAIHKKAWFATNRGSVSSAFHRRDI